MRQRVAGSRAVAALLASCAGILGSALLAGAGAEAASPPAGADPVVDQLRVTAEALAQIGPQRIDDSTVLETVSAEGKKLIFHYSLSGPAGALGDRLAALHTKNLMQACHHNGMRQMMTHFDVVFVYRYVSSGAAAPTDDNVDEKVCKAFDATLPQ